MSDKAIPPTPEKPKSSGAYRGLIILSSIQTLLLIGILAALGSIAVKINAKPEGNPLNVQIAQPRNSPVTVAIPTSSVVYVKNPSGSPVSATIVSTVTVSAAFGSVQTVTAR